MNKEENQSNNAENLIQKIESIFEFDQETINIPTTFVEKLSAFEGTSNKLLDISRIEVKTIEEKEVIDAAFKTMIECGLAGLEVITKTIKIGSSGKDLEGYSKWFDSVSMTIERLINYKMKIRDIQMMSEPPPQQQIQNNTLIMDGKGLAEMLKNIKKDSQLNNIVVDFKVEDTAFEEKKDN